MPRLPHARGANSENFQNTKRGLNFTFRFFPDEIFQGGYTPPQHPLWATLLITYYKLFWDTGYINIVK
jgi:hypothetical protein